MNAYTAVPTEGSGAVKGGIRLRAKPMQVFLLAAVALIIGVPLLAGSERRAAMHSYVGGLGGHRHSELLSAHIPPATGGIPDDDDVPLTLEARLKHLLQRPVLEQFEAELPNRHGCPFYTYSRNTYFFHDGLDERWHKVTKDEVRRYRQKIVDFFRTLDRENKPIVWDKSMEENTPVDQRRGLIYTGGEGKTLERLRFSLEMLRDVLKSEIPVEIYYFEGEFADQAVRDEFKNKWKAELIQSTAKKGDGKSWVIKNHAFIETKFTQFVYMDSDNMPLMDPLELFDSIEFKQSGSVFWPDLNKDHPDNAIFRIMGRECTDDHWPAESGQVIFDKSGNDGLNLAVLLLSAHMMQNEDMYGFLSYGDKDTYRYSFYALGLDYQQPPRMFASVGGYQRQNAESSPDYFCGHAMIQWGLTPEVARYDSSYHPPPAFLHQILTKHRYGLQPDKLFSHAKFPREDGINDPRLVRTLYEFTGDCFAIELKGPDGLPDTPNSYGDGQGTLIRPMAEVLHARPHVAEALAAMTTRIAGLNKPGDR